MKLSIITINYNNKAGLQKTIDSVVAQTWRDFEWIIIDGGSTDGSKELIEQYQQHFAYWCSEPDKGVYNAMNKGIDKARGEYLLFLNSGDCFYAKDTLEQIFVNNTPNADMVYGDWARDEKGRIVLMKAPQEASLYSFYVDNICHQAMFIKSSAMREEGYDETYKFYADWAQWLKMMLNNATSQYVPVVVCLYDTQGMSSDVNAEMMEEMQRFRSQVPSEKRALCEKVRDYFDESRMYKKELSKYESEPIIQDTYTLMKENSWYYRLIRLNLFILMLIKRIMYNLSLSKK